MSSSEQPSISAAGRDLLETGFRADSPEEAYTKWAATYDNDSFDALGFSSPTTCAQVAVDHIILKSKSASNASPTTNTTAAKVLDMGCGTGALGTLLKKKHGLTELEIDGSDLTQAMLDVAASQTDIYKTLQRLDLSQTPWPYKEKVLQEFCRVLKVGGHAILMIREDDVQKWEPAFIKMEQGRFWEMTYQTQPKDNFENASGFNSESKDGKVWYRIKVFTKL